MTYTTIHILKFLILIVAVSITFFIFPISKTHAYLTSNQEAVVLDNHSALFSIDYDFGTKNHALHMPVLAKNTLEKVDRTVSYSIIDNEGNVAPGRATGIVFSGAPLTKQGEYVTPKNEAWQFTLAVLFTPEVYDSKKQYRLQVNHLPFSFDGTQQLQLNPSELKYYTTKLISL